MRPVKVEEGMSFLDKEEILYEQLQKQYDINLKQTEALCNVMNSIKSIFKYLIVGSVIVAIVISISYFWSPQDLTWSINGDKNVSDSYVEGGDK